MASYQTRLAEALAEQLTQDGRCDPAIAPTVASIVAGRVQLDGTGHPVVPVANIIEAVKTENPEWFATLRKPAESTPGRARSSLDTEMDAARRSAEAARNAHLDAVEQFGNPWLRGATWNITRQSILQNTRPAIAAKLRAEAGI